MAKIDAGLQLFFSAVSVVSGEVAHYAGTNGGETRFPQRDAVRTTHSLSSRQLARLLFPDFGGTLPVFTCEPGCSTKAKFSGSTQRCVGITRHAEHLAQIVGAHRA